MHVCLLSLKTLQWFCIFVPQSKSQHFYNGLVRPNMTWPPSPLYPYLLLLYPWFTQFKFVSLLFLQCDRHAPVSGICHWLVILPRSSVQTFSPPSNSYSNVSRSMKFTLTLQFKVASPTPSTPDFPYSVLCVFIVLSTF